MFIILIYLKQLYITYLKGGDDDESGSWFLFILSIFFLQIETVRIRKHTNMNQMIFSNQFSIF